MLVMTMVHLDFWYVPLIPSTRRHLPQIALIPSAVVDAKRRLTAAIIHTEQHRALRLASARICAPMPRIQSFPKPPAYFDSRRVLDGVVTLQMVTVVR